MNPPSALDMRNTERGATLLVAMVVLLALTLAGVSAMYLARTDTELAGNIRFRDQATQDAETSRQAMTQYLLNSAFPPEQSLNRPTWVYPTVSTPVAIGTVDWDTICNASPCKQTLPDGNIGQNIVEALGPFTTTKSPGQSMSQGGKYQSSAGTYYHYRVTTRVSGPKGTVSLVQVIYRINY